MNNSPSLSQGSINQSPSLKRDWDVRKMEMLNAFRKLYSTTYMVHNLLSARIALEELRISDVNIRTTIVMEKALQTLDVYEHNMGRYTVEEFRIKIVEHYRSITQELSEIENGNNT